MSVIDHLELSHQLYRYLPNDFSECVVTAAVEFNWKTIGFGNSW